MKQHHNDCNVWKTSQQCDRPDLTRTCTCHILEQLDKAQSYLNGIRYLVIN